MALRYLRSRKGEGYISFVTWMSFIGIMLGVAILIIVTSVMNGFRQELLKKMMGMGGHIVVYAPQFAPLPDSQTLVEKMRKIDGVALAFPYIEAQVLLSTDKMGVGGQVRGLKKDDFLAFFRHSHIGVPNQNLEKIAQSMTSEGKPAVGVKLEEMPTIVLGDGMAKALGVKMDEFVTVLYPHGAPTPFGMMPRFKQFPVGGIFKVGMSEYDRVFAFINMHDAESLFNMKDPKTQKEYVTAIEIFVTNLNRVDAVAGKIQAILPPDYPVLTWEMLNGTFSQALQVERNVMFLILTLILVIASFNIVTGLVMLVQDKMSHIAILRTIGATRGCVARIFFLMGTAIGLAGTGLGCMLGLLICWNIETLRAFLSWALGVQLFSPEVYFLSSMPAQIDWYDFFGIIGLSLSFSLLATLYPAWRASSMDPTDVLRYG